MYSDRGGSQPLSEQPPEPRREAEHTNTVARIASRAPSSYFSSYARPYLSPVDEGASGSSAMSESDGSISSYAASGQTGVRRNHLQLLRRRNSSMNESATSSNHPAGGGYGELSGGNMKRGFVRCFCFCFPPIVVSVVCPAGSHPRLRLARRLNRIHTGGGDWTGLDPLLRYM